MQGYLVTNAFMRAGSFARMRDMLLEAAARQGVTLISRTNADFMRTVPQGEAQFALFYDKDVRLARRMEQSGLRVFNSARAIALCDDKTLTCLALQEKSVAQPDFLLCPQTFPGVGYGDMAFIKEAGDALSWPMVIKEGCGSFGQQVYLAQNAGEAQQILAAIGAKPVLLQRFIGESAGRDLRLYVVDGQVIAAIERRNHHGDFRANIENGGNAQAYQPTSDECALAVSACRALGLDFAGVDILPSRTGPLICEVNSNAHFMGLHSATGVNPADHILSYIRRTLCSAR